MSDQAAVVHLHLARIGLQAALGDMTTAMVQLKDCFEGDLSSDSEWDLREVIGRLDSSSILLEELPERIHDIIDKEKHR